MHSDTPHNGRDGPSVLTAFVALQDVDASMGPTTFIPGSHHPMAHKAFAASQEGSEEAMRYLDHYYPGESWFVGEALRGDAMLFDSRTHHFGGENRSPRRRVLFYFSFKAKGENEWAGTLLDHLRGEHDLEGCKQWR